MRARLTADSTEISSALGAQLCRPQDRLESLNNLRARAAPKDSKGQAASHLNLLGTPCPAGQQPTSTSTKSASKAHQLAVSQLHSPSQDMLLKDRQRLQACHAALRDSRGRQVERDILEAAQYSVWGLGQRRVVCVVACSACAAILWLLGSGR